MYAGIARSAQEIEAALRLAAQVFGSILGQDEKIIFEIKTFLWHAAYPDGPEQIIILAPKPDEVVGLIRICPRILYRKNQKFSCGGISSVCIAPHLQGQGLSPLLMTAALNWIQSHDFDMAILFGRRAVDHYYTRFGFWGVSSYNKFLVSHHDLRRYKDDRVKLIPVPTEESNRCSVWYEGAYKDCFGRMDRSGEQWRFIVTHMRRIGHHVDFVFFQGELCGYVVHGTSTIFEMALDYAVPPLAILAMIAARNESDPLTLVIPPEHPVRWVLTHVDARLETRQCSYGGHMIRILNPQSFLSAMSERMTPAVAAMKSAPFTESWEDFTLRWDGVRMNITLDHPAIPTFDITTRLLGSQTLTVRHHPLDPPLSLNISLPDQL
ncbi:MAG: GNAT family N-acetyltransferase [Magnetococcales bacterium]|nr:GNAT family N-acetyltransferase [Magnetococcales bacterium]MBF0150711.1 GNAT family N-acetyltransferase [Magnetococcales bacterium]MBF0174431.1 GNAT family N-acetyltransferase [Magnetococcales bacterium]MBF0346930.1 GNAT family N-acetyltransferase [Magnetococcales bacterium]MBF0631666.1 GNAT family N-acetyltransferase [Magnetococcales bacterium]